MRGSKAARDLAEMGTLASCIFGVNYVGRGDKCFEGHNRQDSITTSQQHILHKTTTGFQTLTNYSGDSSLTRSKNPKTRKTLRLVRR